MAIVVLGTVAGLVTGGVIVSIRETRRSRNAQAVLRHLATLDPLPVSICTSNSRLQVIEINAGRTRIHPLVIAITPLQIALYPLNEEGAPPVLFPLEGLRWFGRPQKYPKYSYGQSEIWLHVEQAGHWFLLRLRLPKSHMQTLVRTLKEVVPEDLVTAYRRRRPYVHYGPTAAQPATQDMQGAWTLGALVDLYLMPLALLILEGPTVQRTIPLDQVQRVAAIKRLDQPGAAGLVRFEASGEPLAFALAQHEAFAQALAEAARRTLEDPVEWQRKKKKQEDGADDEED
jgi:hypothetical protein